MAAIWYVMQGERRQGPFTAETLQDMVDRREVSPRDLVWCEGMTDWVPARTVLKPSDYRPPRGGYERDRYDDGRYERDRDERDRYERDYDDRDDFRSVRRRPGPPAQFPGRLVTPSFFFLCILLFFCPWVDVNCAGIPVAYQSGLQLCYGGYTETTNLEMERRAGAPIPLRQDVALSPFVIGFGALILVGFVMGLALHTGLARILFTAIPVRAGFAGRVAHRASGDLRRT